MTILVKNNLKVDFINSSIIEIEHPDEWTQINLTVELNIVLS